MVIINTDFGAYPMQRIFIKSLNLFYLISKLPRDKPTRHLLGN